MQNAMPRLRRTVPLAMLPPLAITGQPLTLAAAGAGILAVLAVALFYVRFRSLSKIQSDLSDSWGKIDYLLLKRAQLLKNMLRASGKLSSSGKRAVESAKSAWDAILQARTSREKAVAVTLALAATDAIVEYARSTGSEDTQIFRRYVEEVQQVDRQLFALLSFYDGRADAYSNSLCAFPFSEASIQSALGLRRFDKFSFNPEAPPLPVAREEFGVSAPAVSIEPTSMAQVQSEYSPAAAAFAQPAAGAMQQPQLSGLNAAGAVATASTPAFQQPVPSEAVEEKPPAPKRPTQAEADEQDASLWRKIHEMQSQQEAALAVASPQPKPKVFPGIPPSQPEVPSGVSLSQSQPEYSFSDKGRDARGNARPKGEAAFEQESPAASAGAEARAGAAFEQESPAASAGAEPESSDYQSPLAARILQRISEPPVPTRPPEAEEAERPAPGRPAFKEEFAATAAPAPPQTGFGQEEHNPFPVKPEVLESEIAPRRPPSRANEFPQPAPNQQSPSQPPSPYPTPPQNYPQQQFPGQQPQYPSQSPPQPSQYPPAQPPYSQPQFPVQQPPQYPASQPPFPQQQFPGQQPSQYPAQPTPPPYSQPPQYPPQAPPFQPPAFPPASPPQQYYPPQPPQYPQYPPVQPQYPQPQYPVQPPQYPQPYQPPQAPPWVAQPQYPPVQPQYPRPPIYLQQPPQYPPQPEGQQAPQLPPQPQAQQPPRQFPQNTQPSSRQSPPQQTPSRQFPQPSRQNQQPPAQDNPATQKKRQDAGEPNAGNEGGAGQDGESEMY